MKVEIRIRSDSERGLFASENIKKGETICILPIDYIQLDNKWFSFGKSPITVPRFSNLNFRYGILCEIPKMNSEHFSEYEYFKLFLHNKQSDCLSNFFSLNKGRLEVVGVSDSNRTDDNFIGHIINDYVNMSFLTENKYEKLSGEFSNVKVSSKLELFEHNRIGLKIKATKDIKQGKELYLTYGSDYWKKYSGKNEFIYNVKLVEGIVF